MTVSVDRHISIYGRTRVNRAGKYATPSTTIETVQNSDTYIDLQLRDLANDKIALDLTGATVEFYVKEEKYSAISIIKRQIGSGIQIVHAPTGLLTITILRQEMSVQASDYFYNLIVRRTDAVIFNTYGIFRVLPAIPPV